MAQSLARRGPAFADAKGSSIGAWRLPASVAALLLWAAWTSGIDLRLLLSRQTWAALFDFSNVSSLPTSPFPSLKPLCVQPG